MKNQKVMVGIGVAVGIIVLGGIVVSQSGKTTVKNQQVEVTTNNAKMSISDLMGRGENVKCTYEVTSIETGTNLATMYLAGKKVRMETNGSQMLSDGSYTYIWSDKDKTGIKMPIDSANDSSNKWQGQAQYVDPEQKMDYKCEGWKVDESMFVVPVNVQFSDFSQMQKTQCASCDYLSGEQKTSCKKALGCD
jgi:hypothetical protein